MCKINNPISDLIKINKNITNDIFEEQYQDNTNTIENILNNIQIQINNIINNQSQINNTFIINSYDSIYNNIDFTEEHELINNDIDNDYDFIWELTDIE